MTVTVSRRRFHRLSDLSEHARIVLAFVPGGEAWLDWARQDQRPRYRFEDDTALVAAVQDGIHDSPLVLLPRLELIVSPLLLMGLDIQDLRRLARAEGKGGDEAMAEARDVLAGHDLATWDDLTGADVFLDRLGVGGWPLFATMTLGDRLTVLDLMRDRGETGTADFRREAAAFASSLSLTPAEFADYYRIYFGRSGEAGPSRETPAQRQARIRATVGRLEPLLFPVLECPRVEGRATAWDVTVAVQEWLGMGHQLGFLRLSRAVQQVIAHCSFADESEESAERAVAAYLERAQAVLGSADLQPGPLRQDAAAREFRAVSAGGEAVIELRPDGLVALSYFDPWSLRAASDSSTAGRRDDGRT
jgi:hypothetical protein